MLTSNTENFAEVKLPESATFLGYQALEKPIANYVNNNSESNPKIPDFRTTLYWNPQIKISNEGQKINFTASDRKGSYNIIVEGYNSDGQVFYGKKPVEEQQLLPLQTAKLRKLMICRKAFILLG